MQHFPVLLLFFGGIILTIGDIIIKKWTINNDYFLFSIGIFVYMVAMVFLAYSFKFKNIAVASTIFVVFNVVSLTIISWILFSEPPTIKQVIGILLGISAVVFMEV